MFFCTLLLAIPAAAQLLKDPTRPVVLRPDVTDNAGAADVDDSESGFSVNGAPQFPKAKVSAIVVTDDFKYAIINNELVYEGQTWRNVMVSNVKPYSVTLTLDQQHKEITINESDFIIETHYD